MPTSIWTQAIGKLSDQEVKSGVAECVNQGLEWPPSLPEFVRMCRESGVDWKPAFDRLIQRKPAIDRVEKLTRHECGYQIKTQLSADKAEKRFKSVYLRYIEMERNGNLPNEEVVMIGRTTTVMPTDVARENFNASGKKNPFQERIDNLKNIKR